MIKLPNISGLVSMGKALVMANRPELLFGASITATLGAVALAAKGGYDARGLVEEAQNPTVDFKNPEKPLDTKEKLNLTWLCYMPAAVTTLGALGSTTGLHIVHVKEKKALAQAALVAIDEVKQAAKQFEKDNLGVVSDEEKDKILAERQEKMPFGTEGNAHIQNSDGEVEEMFLVRDLQSGRDIWSNKARIEEAIVEIGNMINGSESASLNNFYEQAGYGRIASAELLGWSGVLPTIKWHDENGQALAGVRDDGRPFRGFRFLPEPEKGYEDTYR